MHKYDNLDPLHLNTCLRIHEETVDN
uniref:Uncharacterized protein n=1 Tax=Arundo donax TaxID=35708 RepID=A0A0A9FR83_ARUDO